MSGDPSRRQRSSGSGQEQDGIPPNRSIGAAQSAVVGEGESDACGAGQQTWVVTRGAIVEVPETERMIRAERGADRRCCAVGGDALAGCRALKNKHLTRCFALP
jgi:hypothetical protein